MALRQIVAMKQIRIDLLALARFVALQLPRFAHLFTHSFSRLNILIVFMFCACVNAPRIAQYDILEVKVGDSNITRTVARESDAAHSVLFRVVYGNVIYCVIMFVIPLTSLAFINFRLYTFLCQQGNVGRRSSESDVTRSLVAIVIVFIVCQLPALVTQLLSASLDRTQQVCPSAFFYYARLSDACVVINSVVNVIIYAVCVPSFRLRMRRKLRNCAQPEVESEQLEMDAETKNTETLDANDVERV